MSQRVGIDLTSAALVREAIDAHGARYLERVYTAAELLDCAGDPTRLAGRFAAKEAAIKVLRPRRDAALPWTDIEVVRDTEGYVELRLAGLAAVHAAEQGLTELAVSADARGRHRVRGRDRARRGADGRKTCR